MSEFLSQTDLGKLFDASSHDIGKWLVECGLRTDGKPTQRALNGGYVSQASIHRGGQDRCFDVWHKIKTIAALEAAGHRQKLRFDPESDGKLRGPFEAEKFSVSGFNLFDAEGNFAIVVFGENNAEAILDLLNEATKNGKFS